MTPLRRSACWTGPPAAWSTSSSRAPSVEDLAAVRRRVDVPIAADESIRRAEDPYRVRDLEAADVAVLKVQPLGGVRACLRIAEEIGLPVVVSSRAGDVGRDRGRRGARGGAARAALRVRPGDRAAAHRRRGRQPLLPVDGALPGPRPVVDLAALDRLAAPAERVAWWEARYASVPRCGRIAVVSDVVPTPATALAQAVVERLLAAGVADVVLAPGSRNAPLAFAVWAADQAGPLRLHIRIDERTAGFLALGLSKVGARAAVMCTSGTAVANLHPAVLEAAHAGVAAGRRHRGPAGPAARHGRQPDHRPGRHLRRRWSRTHDVSGPADLAAVQWGLPGPVHLNIQLDEPLVPPRSRWSAAAVERPACHIVGTTAPRPVAEPCTRRGPRTVVVAGDDAGPPARLLAEAAGWPLLAEPTSGARTGEHALRATGCCSASRPGAGIERVVVFGHPTLSRPVTRLLGPR